MNNLLITKQGRIVELLSGATHDVTCRLKLGRTLRQFIRQDGGVRICYRSEQLAVESAREISFKQLLYINNILRGNDIYLTIVCINGKAKTKQSFRPIRGLQIN